MEYKTDWSVEGTPEQQEEFAKIITDKTGVVLVLYDWRLKPVSISTEHSKGYKFLSGGYDENKGVGMSRYKKPNHFILPQDKEKALDYILCRDNDSVVAGDVLFLEDGRFKFIFTVTEVVAEVGKNRYMASKSLNGYKDKWKLANHGHRGNFSSYSRKATPEEVKWLEACEKAGEFVSKEDALKESFGNERGYDLDNDKVAIKCKSQEEFDVAQKELDNTGWSYNSNDWCCLAVNADGLSYYGCGSEDYYKKNGYKIISFEEFCKDRGIITRNGNLINATKNELEKSGIDVNDIPDLKLREFENISKREDLDAEGGIIKPEGRSIVQLIDEETFGRPDIQKRWGVNKDLFKNYGIEFTSSTIGSLDGSKSNPVTQDDTASIGGRDVDLILKDIIDTSINTSQSDFKTGTIKETADVDGNYTIGVDPYTINLLDILDSRMLGWIKKENNKKDLDDSKKIHKLAIENDTEEPKELKVFKTNINKLKL